MSKFKLECGCDMDLFDNNPKTIDKIPSVSVDYYNINLTCPKTWSIFHSGKTKGIFQLEGGTGIKWCKEIKPSNILEAAAVISLIRPGCLHYDVQIMLSNNNSVSIEELFNNKDKYINTTILSIDEKTHSVINNVIVDIMFSGMKNVYQLKGFNLVGTYDHPVLTQRGWVEIGKLEIGDIIYTYQNSKMILHKFTGIKYITQVRTYDISVEGPNHNFIAGNVVVHNCTKAFMDDGKSMTKHYADRKNLKEEAIPIDPSIHDALSETQQIICYQEQCMQIARDIAGFDLQQADVLRKCISGDTKFISKKYGYISVKDIVQYDYTKDVFLTLIDDKLVWKKIKNIWSNGFKKTYNVKTNNSSIRITSNHQLLTLNDWKDLSNITNDDFITTVNKVKWGGIKFDKNLAIIIAGLITEGYFVEKKSTFTNFNRNTLDRFNSAFFAYFGKNPKLDKNGKVLHISKTERVILNKYINYGLSKFKHIPQIMMQSDKECMRSFLSFMFECEASFSGSQIEYVSKSKLCIEQIRLLLNRFGIRSYIIEKVDKTYGIFYRLFINDVVEQEKFYNELSCELSKTKKDKLLAQISKKQRNYSQYTTPNKLVKNIIKLIPSKERCGSLYTNDISESKYKRLCQDSNIPYQHNTSFSKVKIEEYGLEEVFDFTMEDGQYPWIIANNIVIHNSIGKKDAKLLASLRDTFVDGCKKVGLVSEEKAVSIFDNIEKSNRYSFNKCLSPQSIVTTSKGPKSLSELKIGDKVLGKDGFINVVNIYHNGMKDVCKFVLENNKTVICTIDHKVKTTHGMRPIGNAMLMRLPIQTINGYSLVSHIYELGQIETMDIEVDSEDHTFYANDILVSNSHAVEYSMIGYWTAWAKAHFPLHFYTAWLSFADQKMDYESEVSDLVQDARGSNIFVLNPSIDKVHKEFKIEDGNIRFGFGLVKSMGESAFIKFKETIEQNHIENFSYEEFLFKVSPKINKTVMYNITYVGALDKYYIDRNKILFDYDIILKLTDKEIAQIVSITQCKLPLKESLQKLLSEGKVISSRKQKISDLILTIDAPGSILKDTPALKANWEVEFLGIALSSSPLESCKTIGDTTCEEFVNGKTGECKIAGEILDVREYIIKEGKNAGKEMAFVKIKDLTGIVDSVVFSEVYNKFRNLLIKGNTLLITGNRSPQESLVINKVTQI